METLRSYTLRLIALKLPAIVGAVGAVGLGPRIGTRTDGKGCRRHAPQPASRPACRRGRCLSRADWRQILLLPVYFTGGFVEKVQAARLKGVSFVPVWSVLTAERHCERD